MNLIHLHGGPHDGETRICPTPPGSDYWVFSHYTKCPDGWVRHQITTTPHLYVQDQATPTQYHYQERQ